LYQKLIPLSFVAYQIKNTLMSKMTDYVALWEKYKREGVSQKNTY